MTIHPDQIAVQIAAAESILKPYISDPAVLVGALAMQIVSAFIDAAPAKKKRAEAFKDEPAGFSEFYTAFPRHEARRDAATAYRAAITRAPAGIILAGAVRYAEAMKGTDQKYVKLPATWLRADCWADEPMKLALVGVSAAFEDCSEASWIKRLSMFFGLDGASLWTWRAAWGPDPFSTAAKVPEAAKTRFKAENPRLDLKTLYSQYQARKTA